MDSAVLTRPFVLPDDAVIRSVRGLPGKLRQALPRSEGYIITRARRRTTSQLVDVATASLLRRFRRPRRIVDAVRLAARRGGGAAEQMLRDAFPILRDCINGGLLVPEDAPEARAVLPALERGARIGPYVVLRCVRLLADTEIYQVQDRSGRLLALKLVAAERSGSRARLIEREQMALERLAGESVPTVAGTGTWRGQHWLAMPWIAGVSPQQVAGEMRGSRDGSRDILALCARLARVYAKIHDRGVTHADVHPGNVLVGPGGAPVVLDFGLARMAGGPAGAPAGAIAYFLSPEHAGAAMAGRRFRPTPRSDQFSVAAMSYQLLTGERYADFTLGKAAMLRQIARAEPLPFVRRGTAPMPAVERALRRAMHRDPAARFPSLEAFAAALEAAPAAHTVNRPAPRGRTLEQTTFAQLRDNGRLYGAPLTTRAGASVALGAAGFAYAWYRLATVRGDREALALADSWITKVEREAGAFGMEANAASFGATSPYHTISGAHAVRALIAQSSGDLRALSHAVALFAEASAKRASGDDLYLGNAGTLLAAAILRDALPADAGAPRALLDTVGRRNLALLESAVTARDAADANPAIAHGLGGMIFAALRWSRASGQQIPFDIEAALDRLAKRREIIGRGAYWQMPSGYDAGWCSGSAGLAHVWIEAHRLLRKRSYAARAEEAAWAAWENPADLPDSCCGLSGRAWSLLAWYRHSGERTWLDRAAKLAQRATSSWRRGSINRRYPMSLFKGALGPALLAAELEQPERSCMPFFEAEGWPAG